MRALRRQLSLRPSGFTLLEMLVVIVILAVLMMILLPMLLQQPIKAKDAKAKSYLTLAWQDLTTTATSDEANFGSASELVGQLRYAEPQLNFQTASDCSKATMAGYDSKTVVVVGPQTNAVAITLCIRSDSGTIWQLIAPVSGSDPTIVDTSTLSGDPPVNVVAPAITGDVRFGQRLTAQQGGWKSDTPPTYSYQWQRCSSSGSGCVNVSGATASTYLVGSGDIGSTFKVQVTAANAHGSATATSGPTGTANTNLNGLPSNTAAPQISGPAAQGQTLTASKGTWTGTAPISYSYQWQRSSDGGSTWTDITGATATTYTIPAGDVGKKLQVEVIATNSAGEQDAFSTPTAAVIPPPVSTAPPAITGTAQDAQTLSSSTGSWQYSPTSYSYQWQYSNNGGSTWTDITGATSSSYTLPYSTYDGDTLRVRVTASNAAGSTTASSNATAVVTPAPPTNTSAPTISGSAQDGQTLTGARGSWAGTPTISYSYQWQHSSDGGSTWTNIAGATATTYTVPYGTYTGQLLQLQVTANNSAGSANANSAATATVSAAAPSSTASPTISGSAQDGQTLSTSTGSWVGTPTITYSYQWQYSSDGGSTWTNIAGATSSTYTIPYGTYTGDKLRSSVKGSNSTGNATSYSSASAALAGAPPLSTAAPAVSGTAQDGQTLSSSSGSWTGDPTISYAYQWQYYSGSWQNISGATSSTYTIPYGTYTGDQLRVQVTASNSYGSTAAFSSATATVAAAAPSNTAAPTISGAAQVNSSVTTSNGSWTGTPTISYSYQWQSSPDGSAWSNIAGATSSSYTIASGYEGYYLRAAVTAANGGGSTTAYSSSTAKVVGVAPAGLVVAYAGPSVPSGFLTTDGSCENQSSYASLYSTIGTTYGNCGAGTFDLPDLRGRIVVGLNTANSHASALGNNEGAAIGSRTPYHNHTVGLTSGYPLQGVQGGANFDSWSCCSGGENSLTATITVGPQSNTPLDTPAYITLNNIIASSPTALPAGSVLSYAGSSLPSGWAFADGSCLSQASYPALYSAIGTTYGNCGAGTFDLPDTRGRMLVGLNGSNSAVSALGANEGDSLAARSPYHHHSVGYTNGATTFMAVNGGSSYDIWNCCGGSGGDGRASVTVGPSGTPTDTPAFLTTNYIIALYANSTVPTGGTSPYAGSSAPTSYLIDDGSCQSSASYSNLSSSIGTTYGNCGAGTFNLPDLRGRTAVGLDTSVSAVSALGDSEGTALSSRSSYHSHSVSITNGAWSFQSYVSGSGWDIWNSGSGSENSVDAMPTVGPTANVPTDTPAYLTLNYITKT